jgi:hypothetical protein
MYRPTAPARHLHVNVVIDGAVDVSATGVADPSAKISSKQGCAHVHGAVDDRVSFDVT